MMAFFFTMPISRMMPIRRHHVQLGAAQQQRQQRADAGRGKRGEDRDRVDVAFVEDAQHDVDGDQRRQDQQRLDCAAKPERPGRCPESCRECVAGMPNSVP